MSKQAVREWLFEHGRWPAEEWRSSWLFGLVGNLERWPQSVRDAATNGAVPAVARAEDLVVVVAGGNIPIPQHVYCPSWGFPPARISRQIRLPDLWEDMLAEAQAAEHKKLGIA